MLVTRVSFCEKQIGEMSKKRKTTKYFILQILIQKYESKDDIL